MEYEYDILHCMKNIISFMTTQWMHPVVCYEPTYKTIVKSECYSGDC